jgi:hypothetical protein
MSNNHPTYQKAWNSHLLKLYCRERRWVNHNSSAINP